MNSELDAYVFLQTHPLLSASSAISAVNSSSEGHR